MTTPKKDKTTKKPKNGKKHLDELLDEALKETFPASDPPAMTEPSDKEPGGKKS